MFQPKSIAPTLVAFFAGLFIVPALAAAHPAYGAESLRRIDTVRVPGHPLASFDVSVVDGRNAIYALADRSNAGIDLIDARRDKFVGRVTGFVGSGGHRGHGYAGPNGIAIVGAQLWAGDGDSTVKVVDVPTRKIVATIPTGGQRRVDELAYDPRDHLVIAANNADKPPFLTFISTTHTHRIVGRLHLPSATAGLEQPVWDSATGLFYVAIPEIGGDPAHGAIAVIEPRTRKLVQMRSIEKCMPAGLALGSRAQLLVGCSDDAVAAGFAPKSLVMDAPSGKTVATIRRVGGSDEGWFDPKSRRFYLAAAANTGGPVLGVVDAATDRWIGNIPTGSHAHSVAADPNTGKVFVPMVKTGVNGQCKTGCVAVYADREHAERRHGTPESDSLR